MAKKIRYNREKVQKMGLKKGTDRDILGRYTADTSFFPLRPPFTFGKQGCFWPYNGKIQVESV